MRTEKVVLRIGGDEVERANFVALLDGSIEKKHPLFERFGRGNRFLGQLPCASHKNAWRRTGNRQMTPNISDPSPG